MHSTSQKILMLFSGADDRPRLSLVAVPNPADVLENVTVTATPRNGTASGLYAWEEFKEGGSWQPVAGTLDNITVQAADGLRWTDIRATVTIVPENPKYATEPQSGVVRIGINPGLGTVAAAVSEAVQMLVTESGDLLTTETGETILTG